MKGLIYCHGELSSDRHVCSLDFGTLIQQGNVDFLSLFQLLQVVGVDRSSLMFVKFIATF